MWPVNPPQVTSDESFLACISGIKDRKEKADKPARPYSALLAAATSAVGRAAQRFETAARQGRLHELRAEDFRVPGFENLEAHSVIYSGGMVRNDAGRNIYNAIMATPPYKRCPLCSRGLVSQMDHHLPKSIFPALCVTPLNLVPACKDCNELKGNFYPTSAESALIHPYIDRIDSTRWLNATVNHDPQPTLDFFVDPPSEWDRLLVDRVKHHFTFFELDRIFGTQANWIVGSIGIQVENILVNAGVDEVRAYLTGEAESRFKVQRNSWEGVAYHALANDEWFCKGEFMRLRDSDPEI